MDDEQIKDDEFTVEDQESEQEALSEVKEDELKSKLATDFGIDPEDEPELFEKLLKREQDFREKLSGAIKQKIKYREQATKASKEKGDTPPTRQSDAQDNIKLLTQADIDRLLDEREAKRDLESLEVSDDIKTEISDLAKLKGISIREASKHPYITTMIEEVEKEKRINSATPKRTGSKGSYIPNIDPSKALDINDFKTPDGNVDVEAWKAAKKARMDYEASLMK